MKFSITKRGVATPIVALVAVAAFAGIASAAPSATLQSFGDGTVTINSAGTGATLDNGAGQYSGVYLKSKSQSNKPLAAVDFSFDHSGSIAGGAPRLSIPLNTGSYAFLDAINCGNTNTGTVSTELANCPVFINTCGSFDNWDAMAAAHPEWRIGSGKIPFVIADQAGTYIVSNIVLR